MTSTSVLHQTLRDLCRDAWCYAVFWKLKRQSRMVLAWEDAFYEQSKTRELCGSHPNPLPVDVRVSSSELSNMEDPIGLSVAKMSYHIYSVGEGIIGKIAFTNKHQWVFSPSNKVVVATGIATSKRSMRSQPDKYPAGWDHQFAAGINTIAVIAVPQGVVQLGSTQTISEDMKLVAHVKALFGTLQNIPVVYPSDLVTEVQKGGVHTLYPMSPQIHHANTSRVGVTGSALVRTQPMAIPVGGVGGTGVEALGGTIGHSTVGRIPLLFNSCSQTQPQLLPVVIGMPTGPIQRPHCASYMSAGDSGNQTPTTISKSPNVDLGHQCLRSSGKNLGVDLRHQEPITIGKNQYVELPRHTPALVDKNSKVELFRQAPTPNIWAHRVGMGSMKATVPPRLGIISKFSLTTDHSVEAKNTSCLPSVTSAKCLSVEMPDTRVPDKIEVPTELGVSSHVLVKTNSPTETMFPSSERSTYISSRVKTPPGSKSTVKGFQVVGRSKSLVEDREVVSTVEHVAGRSLLSVPQPLRDRFPKKVQEPICYSPQVDKPVADFINSRHSKNSPDVKTLGDYHVSRRLDSEQHLPDVSQTVDNQQNSFSGNFLHLSQSSRNSKGDVERPNVSDCDASSEAKQLFCGHPSTGGMQLLARHSVRLTTASGHESLEDKRHLLASADKYQTDTNRHLICKHQSSFGGQILKPSHQIVRTESCEVSHPVTLRCSEVDSVPVDTKVSALYKSGLIANPESTSCNSMESRVVTHPYKGFQPLDAANSGICSDGQTSHMLQLSEISEHGITDSSTVTTGLDDNLFCEGFMDDWNSATVPIRDVDFSASQYLSGGDGDGEQNAFKTELEDFEKFLASLTNENEDKNELISDVGAGGTCSFPNKETLACKVGCNIQKGGHLDWSTEVRTTQEGLNRLQQAVIPVPPLHNQGKTRRQLKKRVFSGGDIMSQQEERQKIHKCLLELQNIIPGGGNYTIDALLDKTAKYADFLQKTLHDPGNQTQIKKWQKVGNRIGVTERGVEDKEINASWVMELNQEGNRCPIIVEDLAQPQHMLVEMVCERTGTIKEIKRSFKKLHVVVLKDIMEARNNRIWARFVVEAPQDVHRIQVLWSLMQLLEPK